MILIVALSLAVVTGLSVVVWQLRRVHRYVDADTKLIDAVLSEVDTEAPKPKLASVTSIGRFRPSKPALAIGSALVGMLGTCALFAAAEHGPAPGAASTPADQFERSSETSAASTITAEASPATVVTTTPSSRPVRLTPAATPADTVIVVTTTATTVSHRERPDRTRRPRRTTPAATTNLVSPPVSIPGSTPIALDN